MLFGFGISIEVDILFVVLDIDYDGCIIVLYDFNLRFIVFDVNCEFLMFSCFFLGFFYLIIFVGVDCWIKGMIVGLNKVYYLVLNFLGVNIKIV